MGSAKVNRERSLSRRQRLSKIGDRALLRGWLTASNVILLFREDDDLAAVAVELPPLGRTRGALRKVFALDIPSLTGILEFLLGSLSDSRYLLVSVLRPPSFLLSEYDFRRKLEDVLSPDYTFLPPPLCFFMAVLDILLYFSLPLSLLDVSLPSDSILSAAPPRPMTISSISPATAESNSRYDHPPPPPALGRKAKLVLSWHPHDRPLGPRVQALLPHYPVGSSLQFY